MKKRNGAGYNVINDSPFDFHCLVRWMNAVVVGALVVDGIESGVGCDISRTNINILWTHTNRSNVISPQNVHQLQQDYSRLLSIRTAE